MTKMQQILFFLPILIFILIMQLAKYIYIYISKGFLPTKKINTYNDVFICDTMCLHTCYPKKLTR